MCRGCRLKKKLVASSLTKKFPSTFRLCDGNLKKFVLLLRKGVYLPRINFIVSFKRNILVIKIMFMHKEYGMFGI